MRDKQQLIKIAASQTLKMFKVIGNVEVIDISPYNAEFDGYTVVVEFEEGMDRGVVAAKRTKN